MDKDASDKHILWMYRESKRLTTAFHETGWIKLDQPVKVGYERTFRLKPEVAARPDAAFIEELLQLINCSFFAKNKNRLLRKKRKYRVSKWRWERRVKLGTLTQQEYERLPREKRKYFSRTLNNQHKICYVFRKPIYFEEYIRPVYSDKIQIENRGLWEDSMLLDRKLHSRDYRGRYFKVMYFGEGKRYSCREKTLQEIKSEHHFKNLRSIKKYGYELTNQGCEFRGPDFFIRFPFR
jgi:Txe/YoeB family toxin of Txe-Axe toxin-antitoxin module